MKINNLIARFLVNKTTKEEWDTLESWKQESKSNLNELLEMQNIWDTSVDLNAYKQFDKKSAWDLIDNQIVEAPVKTTKLLNLKWAAGIAAAVTLIIVSVFSFGTSVPDGYNHISAAGLIENVTLPDGSNIFMNKNSELDYASNFIENRTIILDGEAYFDVARDEKKPFEIETDHAQITVLGTSFNVEEHGDYVDIYVTSGKVKVVSGDQEVILTKNEMVKCSNGKITKLSGPGKNYLSWKTGKLEFSEVPLHKVVEDLTRHFNKKLTFSSTSKAMNQSVTSTFAGEDFDSVLETLVLITGIKYHKEGQQYVIQ